METPLSLFHLCPAANKNTLEMVQYGVEGSSTFLECQARSPHAVIKWHLQRDNSDRRKEVRHHTQVLCSRPVLQMFVQMQSQALTSTSTID